MGRPTGGSWHRVARGAAAACLLALLLPLSLVGASPAVSFAAPVSYAVYPADVSTVPETYLSYSIVAADLNDDGTPDIVTADLSSFVSVLLGGTGGAFHPHADYASGGHALTVAVADINGDGKPDLVVGNADTQAVSILLGNGDGTFQPHREISIGSDAPAIAVGDFNGDGAADLAIPSPGDTTVHILLGNGDGTFHAPVAFPTGGANAAWPGIAAGDFNGDGAADLAIANTADANVSVLLGNGDGTFQSPSTLILTGPRAPQFIAAADLNADGRLDLVIGDQGRNVLRVALGNGDGTFRTPVTYRAGDLGVPSLCVGDVNGDGWPDLAVSVVNDVVILTNNGDGTFAAPIALNTNAVVQGMVSLDANGDGKPDLAGFGDRVRVLRNTEPVNAAPSARPNPVPASVSPAPAPPRRPGITPTDLPPSRSLAPTPIPVPTSR